MSTTLFNGKLIIGLVVFIQVISMLDAQNCFVQSLSLVTKIYETRLTRLSSEQVVWFLMVTQPEELRLAKQCQQNLELLDGLATLGEILLCCWVCGYSITT